MGSMRGCEITIDTIIERRKDIPTADLDGEIGMMNIEKGQYFALDEVGSYIWSLLDKSRSIKSIIVTLLEEYEVDTETCKEQTLKFIKKLYYADLIYIN